MRFFNFYAFLIGGALLLSCNGKKEYKLEEVLSVEQQQDLRWIKADSCKCFVLNSFAENPLDSVYVSWSGRDSNGLANGFGRLLIEDKDGARLKYEGTVESGFIKGSGVLTKPDKSVYNGGVYFVEYGKGDRVFENGDQETGIFQDGNLYTGKINKVDTTIHRWRSLEITKTEYNRRQKQVNKYFTKPIIRQTTRYYFDSLWIPCKKEDAAYYRLVNMSDVNHPKDGVVTDFYINGNKQNEYEVLHTDLKNHTHIPGVYSKFYLESGELVKVSNNFNWKLNRTKWYNNENKISQEYILQQDYSPLYNLYDENGVITETIVYDRERKHRYAKESNGDTTYTVYDSLGYKKVLYWERESGDDLIEKGWYKVSQMDDYAYPISPIKYYSSSGKLVQIKEWINNSDTLWWQENTDEIIETEYLGNNNLQVTNNSDQLTALIFDFKFPSSNDWEIEYNFKIKGKKGNLAFTYDWEDYLNHCVCVINNDRGGSSQHARRFNGDFFDTKRYYDYNTSTDWNRVVFSKRGGNTTINGITRNPIRPMVSDITDKSVGLVLTSSTYEFSGIVFTTYYDTLALSSSGTSSTEEISPSGTKAWVAYGSGVVLTEDGYVVTNHHVIEDASDVEIGLVENNKIRYYSGEIISKDINNDLALVRISDNSFKGFDRIPYNVELDQASVGKEVFALGYPLKALLGDELKFTNGRISARSGAKGDISKYQMTVPLQPGNSGGPVFDFDGNLIGIAQGGIKYDVAENVAYCVKTTYLQSLVESLPEKFGLPDDRRNRGEDVEDIINEVAPYVTLIRVR